MMYIYLNLKAHIFIEEYDYLINHFIRNSGENIDETFELMNDFYEATLV